MLGHIRGSLWLLCLTLIVCSGLYPLALWGIGRTPFFREKTQGSLISDKEGKVVGSRLIAQPFTSDEFFQPRPSAASYNGMASSGSNWGANNYRLRDRVARALGPIVRYGKGAEKFGKKPGDGAQMDVEAWFSKDSFGSKPGIVAQWAEAHSGLAEDWIKATGEALKDQYKAADKDKKSNEAFVLQWQADFPDLVKSWNESDEYRAWTKQNPGEEAPSNGDLVQPFFKSFSKKYPGEWPSLEDYETKEKDKRKRFGRVKQGSEIQAVFFDMWRQDNPDVPLEEVPADMVMASGSGLDPHITLENARYQLKYRVAAAQADKLVAAVAEPTLKAKGEGLNDPERKQILEKARKGIETKLGGELEGRVRREIEELLVQKQEAPFGGLVGVPIVNVLELNLALTEAMNRLATAIK
jgi:K+-transporting ATPase ATPase C chain